MFVDGRFLQVHLCLPWLLLLWSEQQGVPVVVRDGWEGTARSPGLFGPRGVLLARGPHLPPQEETTPPPLWDCGLQLGTRPSALVCSA